MSRLRRRERSRTDGELSAKSGMVAAKPPRPKPRWIILKSSALKKPADRRLQVLPICQELVSISKVHNCAERFIPCVIRAKVDERIRFQLSVGASLGDRCVVGNIVGDAVYTLDQSVRMIGHFIKDVSDHAALYLCRVVWRYEPKLEPWVRKEACVLSQHLLTVLRALERAQSIGKVPPDIPLERSAPLRQTNLR
jgi:hypothetical protein